MTFRNVLLGCTFIGALTLASSPAYATSISVQASAAPSSGLAGSNSTVTFNAFDPALGTLQTVGVRYDTHLSYDLTYLGLVSATLPTTFTLAGAVSYLDVSVPTVLAPLSDVVGLAGVFGAGFGNTAQGATVKTRTTAYNNPATLLAYEGTGTFDGTFAFGPLTLSLGAASVIGTITRTADITVTYEYEAAAAPVPEPASMVLLGSGLLGVVAKVRRRRTR